MFSLRRISSPNLCTIEPLTYSQGSIPNNSLNLMLSNRVSLPINMANSKNQAFPQLRFGETHNYINEIKNEDFKKISNLEDKIKEEPIKIEEISTSSLNEELIPGNTKVKNCILQHTLQQAFQPSFTNNSQMHLMLENVLTRAKIEYTKHYIQAQERIAQYSKEITQNLFLNLPFYPNFNQFSGFANLGNLNQNSPSLLNLTSNKYPFQQNIHINSTNLPNISIPQHQKQPLQEKNIVSNVTQSKKIKKDFYERKKRQSELLKNITKNYGKACSKFASTQDGFPYLKKHITNEGEIKEFQDFIKSNAEHIKNIPFFRESILVMPNDSPKIAKFKLIFKSLCETFVSKHAVKWIFSSKQLLNRRGNLSYRRKILRRIQDPENFVNLNN